MSSEYKGRAGEMEALQGEVSKLRASAATSHLEQERMLQKLKLESVVQWLLRLHHTWQDARAAGQAGR